MGRALGGASAALASGRAGKNAVRAAAMARRVARGSVLRARSAAAGAAQPRAVETTAPPRRAPSNTPASAGPPNGPSILRATILPEVQ
jgi:hypothetical protein